MARFDTDDTIAAPATPAGPGLRGLLRLSGPAAWPIATGLLDVPRPSEPPRSPTLLRVTAQLPGLARPIPAALGWWPGPRTYTGQPTAELHLPGSRPLVDRALSAAIAGGARSAEPGEFTLRAFLSGRIDLARAEAVLGVIEARSAVQLHEALDRLTGGLSRPLDALRDRLLDLLALLEAGLDFADEPDVTGLGREALARDLAVMAADLDRIAARLDGRGQSAGFPRVLLVGPPNTGKSRLFNALAGAEAAIVSPVAGTTRDYLTAIVACGDARVELIDSAGIEPGRGRVEEEAQGSRDRLATAVDLLIECRTADTTAATIAASPIPRRRVWTQADRHPPPADWRARGGLVTSAATGLGLDELRGAVAAALSGSSGGSEGPTDPSGTARSRAALVEASRALARGSATRAADYGDDLVAIDLRIAVDALGHVLGAEVGDDILDRIFSRFCIGK